MAIACCVFNEDYASPGYLNTSRLCRTSSGEGCAACTKLEALRSRILSLKQELRKATEQHLEARMEVNRFHDPFFSRTPAEVVSSIFQLAFPNDLYDDEDDFLYEDDNDNSEDDEDNNRDDTNNGPLAERGDQQTLHQKQIKFQTPLTLAAVCHNWRHVAFATSRLWNFIDIDADKPNLLVRCEIARLWLQRSSQLPLAIHVRSKKLKQNFNDVDLAAFRSIIDLVNEYSSRWHLLDLQISPYFSDFFGRNSEANSETIPILHTLCLQKQKGEMILVYESLCFRTRWTGREPSFVFKCNNVKLRPKNVKLDSVPVASVHVDWSQVLHMNLSDISINECFELLKQNPQWRNCSLQELNIPVSTLPSIGPSNSLIHHNGIQDFSIRHLSSPPDVLFDRLCFPSLRRFTGGFFALCEESVDSFFAFIKRSSCSLRELSLGSVTLGENEDGDALIIPLLKRFPSLWNLELNPYPITQVYPLDHLVKHLSDTAISKETEVNKTFLPELRFFKYTYFYKEDDVGFRSFPWTLLPKIFGPLDDLKNPLRRPLQFVQIYIREDELERSFDYIEHNTLLLMHDILNAGLQLEIKDPKTGFDLIKASQEHYAQSASESR